MSIYSLKGEIKHRGEKSTINTLPRHCVEHLPLSVVLKAVVFSQWCRGGGASNVSTNRSLSSLFVCLQKRKGHKHVFTQKLFIGIHQ